MKVMSADEIDTAHRSGRFAKLMGATETEVALIDAAAGTLTPHLIVELAKAGHHALIDKARVEGRLNLNPTTTKDD
jgi:hypothetical protein